MSEPDSKEDVVSTPTVVVSTDFAILLAILIAAAFPLVMLCFCYCKKIWMWGKGPSLDNSNQLRYETSEYNTLKLTNSVWKNDSQQSTHPDLTVLKREMESSSE